MLTKVQEVLFDLIDLRESMDCSKIKVHGFDEFDNLDQFLEEQIEKVQSIELTICESEDGSEDNV